MLMFRMIPEFHIESLQTENENNFHLMMLYGLSELI